MTTISGAASVGVSRDLRAVAYGDKGIAVLLVALQVQVRSVMPGAAVGRMDGVVMNGIESGGYRSKGQPAGQEMEHDSASNSKEDTQNAMLVSKSMAQALAARRGIRTTRRR